MEEDNMKLIIAIIQPYKLEEVKEELYKSEINLLTVSEVLGHGRQKGVTEVYRGSKETGNLLRKIRLEIAVNDGFVESTVKAIIKGAKTGDTGDGKIFILDLKECIRIRTEERGSSAIG
jgi:nitrogen regulatory protein P-II 2